MRGTERLAASMPVGYVHLIHGPVTDACSCLAASRSRQFNDVMMELAVDAQALGDILQHKMPKKRRITFCHILSTEELLAEARSTEIHRGRGAPDRLESKQTPGPMQGCLPEGSSDLSKRLDQRFLMPIWGLRVCIVTFCERTPSTWIEAQQK